MSEWDWPSRADERRRGFAPEIIDGEFKVVSTRRRAPARPVGYLSCVMIVAVAAAIVVRFLWAPLLMGAALLGIHTPAEMLALVIGLVLLTAAWLQAKLSGKPF